MFRFASSSTADMHVGHLRIALLNYLMAKQNDQNFVVRIDDINTEKNLEDKNKEILDLLGLFQIEYQQVVYQSQNMKFHAAMALQLLHEKKAFSCFCSDEWLQKRRDEAKIANKEYKYDDACRNLPAELVIDNTAPFTVRIARPNKSVVVKDLLQGNISFDPDTIDSFIIMNQNKTSTYDFATAIDDMLSDISMIICDEKYLINTPKQIHIRNQLSYNKEIQYVHIPSIENEENFLITELLKQGFLPEAISNYLILISTDTPEEIFTLKEAQKWLNINTIMKNPAKFDIDILKRLNKAHLRMMDATELSRYVGFADAEIGELARIYLEEVDTTHALKDKIVSIFAAREIPDSFKEKVYIIKDVIVKAPYFETYKDLEEYVMKETGLTNEELLVPLRILLTNTEKGPDIEKIYRYLKNYIGEIVK